MFRLIHFQFSLGVLARNNHISQSENHSKMQHDHLKFFSHGSAASSSMNVGSSFKMGGSGVVPTLIVPTGGAGQQAHDASAQKNRSAVEKHIDIVEYLKKLPESSWVGNNL